MWTMMDAPSDRDYADQQCPYEPEGEDPDNALVPSAPPKEETNDDENCPF